MQLIYNNVNDAFQRLVTLFSQQEFKYLTTQESRNGPVMMIPEPVIVTYLHPTQRVLFNQARDANPFFHLFESLWMLAGRNDVEPLKYYVSTIDNYSDDGYTLHGAYGHRWRKFFERDQLAEIVDELKASPTSRRCVLQMWSVEDDLGRNGKDVPCNTHAYFSIRKIDGSAGFMGSEGWSGPPVTNHLDMTVCNRSNDLVWGMLGANVVHFSFLQEYMAACLGVQVGRYHQITNNLHAYKNNWKPVEWLADTEPDHYNSRPFSLVHQTSLVSNPVVFNKECKHMVNCIDGTYEEPFLRDVAQPMLAAFRKHKQRQYIGDHGAITLIERVHNFDWRIVGRNWLQKRKDNWEAKK